jgi:hypothetical protein
LEPLLYNNANTTAFAAMVQHQVTSAATVGNVRFKNRTEKAKRRAANGNTSLTSSSSTATSDDSSGLNRASISSTADDALSQALQGMQQVESCCSKHNS